MPKDKLVSLWNHRFCPTHLEQRIEIAALSEEVRYESHMEKCNILLTMCFCMTQSSITLLLSRIDGKHSPDIEQSSRHAFRHRHYSTKSACQQPPTFPVRSAEKVLLTCFDLEA